MIFEKKYLIPLQFLKNVIMRRHNLQYRLFISSLNVLTP